MRPRGYDPAIDNAILLGVGSAHAVDGPESDTPMPKGRILVPDPEQRHGWREWFIYPPADQKPGRRPIGFGR
jgi:hypothetical protein